MSRFCCLAVALLLVACHPVATPSDDQIVTAATSGEFTAVRGTIRDCDMDLDYEARVIDLNGDGQPEVFVTVSGTCRGGGAGEHLNLFIKSGDGSWAPQFGFPGIANILETRNLGFPDIEIGGPGACAPVWRWTGTQYELFRTCPR